MIIDRLFTDRDVQRWAATASAAGRHGVVRGDAAGGHVLWGRQHDLAGCEMYPVARLSDRGLSEARRLKMQEWDI